MFSVNLVGVIPAAGFVTLVGVALTVAALAIYLIWVAAILVGVTRNLTTILGALQAVVNQTAPLQEIVPGIQRDIREAEGALTEVLRAKLSARTAPVAAAAGGSEPQEPVADVVVLPTGGTYHRDSCSMVAGKSQARRVPVTVAAERGLSPCKVCEPAGIAGGAIEGAPTPAMG